MSVSNSPRALAQLSRINQVLPAPFVPRFQVSLNQIENYLKSICQNFPSIPKSCNVRKAVFSDTNGTSHGYALTWGNVEAVFRVLRKDPKGGGEVEVVSYALIPPRRKSP